MTGFGRKPVLIGALAVATAGCGEAATDADDPAVTRTDSAGVEIVTTAWTDPPPSSGWEIGAEPSIVFGADETPPVEWYRVAGIDRLSDGRVVVLDEGDNRLRFFAADGTLEREVGTEGDGPGEFRTPAGPVVLPGDTVLVFDRRHARFSRFAPDGTWVQDHRVEPAEGRYAAPNQYRPEGAAGDTVLMVSHDITWRIPEEPGPFTHEVPNLRYLADGTYVGELAEPRVLRFDYTVERVSLPPLFYFPTAPSVRGRDVFVVDEHDYEIRAYEQGKGLRRIFGLARPRRPVTDAEVEAHVVQMQETIEDPEALRRTIEFLEQRSRPDSFAWLHHAYPDMEGNVWVRESLTPLETRALMDDPEAEFRLPYAVFAANGAWLGTARVPPMFTPHIIDDDASIGIQIDELGVQQVVEYPVRRGAAP